MTQVRRRLRRRHVLAVVIALALLAAGTVSTNALGARDRLRGVAHRIELLVDPPPDRPIAAIVRVTPRPRATATQEPSPGPERSVDPSAPMPAPTATPRPTPARVNVDVNLFKHPENHFISEQFDHEWCAVAGTQMVLEMHDKAPLTLAFQKQLASRIGEWESRRDSHNGGWGPAAMVAALEAYGVDGYEVRAYETRADALFDAAKAIAKLKQPVMLLAWRGAHTWIMTGFRADADPLVFDDARVTGAYINDPWYPLVSSIWGASDPPGTFQNQAEMRRNYLPWKRPEGHYPDRDGLFIAVVPTKAQR
jgi:hypothetical protein